MVAPPRFVAYLRVSTDRQGQTRLGLDAQRTAVTAYLKGRGGELVAEVTEVESGKRTDRPRLREALDMAKLYGVALVVAKVDRLARNVKFLEEILSSSVEVVFCDLPQVQGAMGRFIIQTMAAVAQLEAGLISERTKAALEAAKARGVRLGGYRGFRVDGRLGTKVLQDRAMVRAKQVRWEIADIRAEGVSSLAGIARALNARRVPSPRGRTWRAATVQRTLARLGPSPLPG